MNVTNTERLREIISRHRPGDSVSIEFFRDSERRTVDVKLGRQSLPGVVDQNARAAAGAYAGSLLVPPRTPPQIADRLSTVIEAHFGESTAFSVGVEEELMVLDGETFLLAPRGAELIAASDGAALPGKLKSELFASALELNTNICATVDEVAQALVELRRAATALAEERGLLACGGRESSDQQAGGPGDRRRAAL